MALTNPTLLSRPGTISLQAIIRMVFPLVVLISMFGQPNGLFLYLPIYPQIMLFVLLVFFMIWLAAKLQMSVFLWPNVSLNVPLALYLMLSLMSLTWSPDPALGARLLFSTFFKIIFFYALVDLCGRKDTLRRVLQIIIGMSLIFAVQGLALLIGVGAFHLQPSTNFSSELQVGGANLDFHLLSYGIFGLMKVTVDFGGLYLPRCQSIFLEPGFYSNFLELTLFASAAYFNIQPPRRKWVPGLAYTLQGSALLLTFSPIGLIAVGLGGMVFALFTCRERIREYERYGRWAILALVGLGMVIQGVVPGGVVRIAEVMVISKFGGEDSMESSSSSDRQHEFTRGVEMFLKQPVLGWGTNQMRALEGGNISNNALLTAATELGIVGLSFYLALLTCIAFTVANMYLLVQKCRSPRHSAFAGATSAAAVAMVFHSMFIETQWSYYYWTALALLYTAHRALYSLSKGQDTLHMLPAN